jgi:hypothetical protein
MHRLPESTKNLKPWLPLPRRLDLRRFLLSCLTPVITAGTYLLWLKLWDLIFLSLITFALRKQGLPEMHDLYMGHRLVILGFASIFYFHILRSLRPFSRIAYLPLLTRQNFETSFLPGITHGAFTAAILVFLLILLGVYRWVGWVTPYDQSLSLFFGVLLRGAGLVTWALADEWFWRRQVFLPFYQKLATQARNPALRKFEFALALIFTLLLSLASKVLLFSLGLAQSLTLSLAALVFTLRFAIDRTETRSSGYWFGLVAVLQLILGQPLFGHEFSGIFLIKYQANDLGVAAELLDRQSIAVRWISGGAQGLIASLALIAVLTMEAIQLLLLRRKSLERSLAGLLEMR